MNYFIHLEGGECRLSLNLNSYMFMLEHRFKQLIKDKGLKTTFLAKRVGVSQPLLSLYLSGKRKMPLEVEFKLAKELS